VQSLGGMPAILPDLPISAVFLIMFMAGAASHMAIFKLNRKKGHKFFLSMMVFGTKKSQSRALHGLNVN
jgi:hypothetical protein